MARRLPELVTLDPRADLNAASPRYQTAVTTRSLGDVAVIGSEQEELRRAEDLFRRALKIPNTWKRACDWGRSPADVRRNPRRVPPPLCPELHPRGVSTTGWHRLQVRVKGRRPIVTARQGYTVGG